MPSKTYNDPFRVVTIILAGGAGKRLFPLTKDRSKPAVPLAGKYRLIDIPISNCINSGFKRIFVLTQFNSVSLNRHITSTYRFDRFNRGFLEVLAAEQTMSNTDWFQGTADAVRQHIRQFADRDVENQLILAGDQLYRMNFQALLEEHGKRNADVTVAVIPRSEDQASEFGLMKLADDGRIVQFREKPKGDLLREMRCDTERFGLSKAQAAERPYLASMGIYVFKRAALEELLRDPAMIDFGHQVIPRAIESHAVYGFPFDGYWEDLGTAGAFYRANIDLTSSKPHFDFHDMKAPIYTHARFLPPTRMERCEVRDSIVAEGALLKDAEIASSIVGIRAVVAGNVTVDQTLLMGADYYEDEEEHALNRRQGIPDIGVGPGSVLRHAIVDKNARIGANVRILNEAGVQHHDGEGYYIRDGVVMIPKNGVIPDGTVI